MEKNELSSLGQQQRRMLEILWEKEGATVQEVLAEINRDAEVPIAYTTVLTTMQKLEKQGWLTHTTSENHARAYLYKVIQSRNEAIGSSLVSFAQSFLGGNKTLLFQHFVDDAGLSNEEIAEIQKMIEQRMRDK
ncbi:MAG: BlaI/MecI/CopY family transcriptional regulator [Thermoguttaceae bacterium]